MSQEKIQTFNSSTSQSDHILSSSEFSYQIRCETATQSDWLRQSPDQLIEPSSQNNTLSQAQEQITKDERQSEQSILLEEQKDSQILIKLDEFRRHQIVLQEYNRMIQEAFQNKVYRRKTFLGKTLSGGEKNSPHEIEPESNLSKEQQIDDYEIKAQFIKGPDSEQKQDQLYLDIAEDLDRLSVMYINGLSALNNTLPSKNVEKRMYEKMVLQVKTWSNAFNEHSEDPNITQSGDGQALRASVSGSVSGQNQLQNSVRGSSVLSSSVYNDRANSIGVDRASSIDLSRSISVTSSATSLMMSTSSLNLIQDRQSKQQEHKIEMTQCIPKLTRVDQLIEPEIQLLWQEFVSEIQTNSSVSSEIVSLAMEQCHKLDGALFDDIGYDVRHTNLLVNLSHVFFDNIHAEERMAFAETNNFLRFFTQFASRQVTAEKFGKNQMNNVFIKDSALKQTLMCLFEGLTRKQPCFTYLRFVYSANFSKISMSQIDADLAKINSTGGHTSGKVSVEQQALNQNAKVQPPQKEEKKNGPVISFFKNLFSKDKEPKKEEQKKQPTAEIKVDQPTVRESKMLQQQRSYQSMAFLYGAEFIPFPPLPPLNVKDSDLPIEQAIEIQKTYGLKLLKRDQDIECAIYDVQINKHTLLMDQYPEFKPKADHRIHLTELDLKKQRQKPLTNKSAAEVQKEKKQKNLTFHIKELVRKNFEQVLNFMNKIPYSIRAMMKILILKSRGISDFRTKVSIVDDEIRMLADFVVAGWLNTGYRNPKCFGIQPSEKKELELEYVFFQASRMTFEHMMLLQKIPTEDKIMIPDYDIDDLNNFIFSMREQVFVFWQGFIQVDIQEIETAPIPQFIESSMLRIDDLELLYIYSQKLTKEIVENQGKLRGKEVDSKKWSNFTRILSQMNSEVTLVSFSDFDIDFEKPLIPRNRFGWTLSRHFSYQLGLVRDSVDESEFEYFILFLRRNSEKTVANENAQWQRSCEDDIQKFNIEFVEKKLTFSFSELKKNEQNQAQFDQDSSSSMLQRIQSMKEKRDEKILSQRTIAGFSQQFFVGKAFNSERNKQQRLIKIHKLHKEQLPPDQVEGILMNIYNTLRVLLANSLFLLECLRDQSNQYEVKDLAELLHKAYMADRISSKPSLQIQAGCKHIIRLMQKLNLQNQFDIQNKILSHFLKMIDRQIISSRRYLDQMIVNMDTLALDVERYEFNVGSLKAFNTKFEITQRFIQIIQGFNPEVCLFDLTSMSSDGTLKDSLIYKGIILNLCCVNHRGDLQMSNIMLFGQVNKKEIEALREMLKPKLEVVSVNELEQRKVKHLRKKRWGKHHRKLKEFTRDLQNPEKQYFPGGRADDFDKQINKIEDFIGYYTKKYVKYLKSIVKTDDQKYRDILELGLYDIPEQYVTEKQKVDYLRSIEPLDYMNMVKTYTMFLHSVSLHSSRSEVDILIKSRDLDYHWQQHHEFISSDLKAKALRYYIHGYIIKRFYQAIFVGHRATKDYDEYVHNLILQKDNHPDWVLCSEETKQKALQGGKTDDFAADPEWCDPEIYKRSLQTLLRMQEEEMPHAKANYIEEAVSFAILATKIATPYKKSDAWGEPQRMRIMKYLILQMAKYYQQMSQGKTNVKLYSQLLYILQFNIPQIEVGVSRCITQQRQNHDRFGQPINYTELPYTQQHLFVNDCNGYRNKAAEWFQIINSLISEDQEKQRLAAIIR